MSEQENKSIARRFYEVGINRKNPNIIDVLCAATYLQQLGVVSAPGQAA